MTDEMEKYGLPPLSGDGGAGRTGPPESPPEIEGYEITGPLGGGGMGTVWRAVQQSTRRVVALKVLGHTALASEKARGRFEREVELASRLEHPHIARIYDSGLYHGLYYYVMELVDGVPLDEYAKHHGLPRRQVLELVQAVCRAVQHAHQRGVIHRDLKPSNVLVTADGQPHVLDFGLAKQFLETEPSPTLSVGGDVVGTPAYMSPEQAAGQVDQVDMRSDVYSLGAILYQLLAGRAPHELEGTRYEVLRRIAEEEVRRPREVTPDIDRELEALLLKALAREPGDRYASAGALADDIGNYLEGEPLSARAPTTLYFLGKRFRKHRGRVAVAVGLLVALLVMAVWSYSRVADERSRAIEARDVARREAVKARAAADFLSETIASIDPAETGGRPVTIRDVLDRAAGAVDARFTGQPLLAAEVRQSLGTAYTALGDYDAAARQFSVALSIEQQFLGENTATTLASMYSLAEAFRLQGKAAEAEQIHQDALQRRRAVLGEDHPDTLRSMNGLAKTLFDRGKVEECAAIQQQVVQKSRGTAGENDVGTLALMKDLAATLWHIGRRTDAERLCREVLDARRRAQGEEHPDTLSAMHSLADALWDLGRREDAAALLRREADTRRKSFGKDNPATLKSLATLGGALAELGRHEEAEPVRREELRLRERLSAKGLTEALAAMNKLANDLYWQGKYADAEGLHEDVLRIWRRLLGGEHPFTLVLLNNLANDLYAQSKCDRAAQIHREVLEVRRRTLGPEHPATLLTVHNLANALFHQGLYGEAETLYRQVAVMRGRQLGEQSQEALSAMEDLRAALQAQGKQEEALAIPRSKEQYRSAPSQGVSAPRSPETSATRKAIH